MKPEPPYLENKTTQSLHDRFSEVLMEQLTQRKVLFKGRQRSMVLHLRNIPRAKSWSRIQAQGAAPKASVWTRIGWKSPWRQGVWNFRNKYRRRVHFSPAPSTQFSPAHNSRFLLVPRSCLSLTPQRTGLGGVMRKRRLLGQMPQPFKGAALSLNAVLKKRRSQGALPRLFKAKSMCSRLGVASAVQRRALKKAPPTKKQLDLELDQYMSKSRSRLDQQLDDYMSRSRSRLDKELDEYMAMAGDGDSNKWS